MYSDQIVLHTDVAVMSVETLLKCITPTTGEGPHWDNNSQTLIFVDIAGGIVFRWDSKTGKLEQHKFGE